MEKYYITYVVHWKLTIEVDAENEEQAHELAEKEFETVDLNEMEIGFAWEIDKF